MMTTTTMHCLQSGRQWLHTTMASRRVKIDRHIDDLEDVYFATRRQNGSTFITSLSFDLILVDTVEFFVTFTASSLWFGGV